jgi:hypothetical protein
MEHQTSVESILSIFTGDRKGVYYVDMKAHRGEKGIYASLVSTPMRARWPLKFPTIRISLDFIDSVRQKFIINFCWAHGHITEYTYLPERGPAELKVFLEDLTLQNFRQNEIVFQEEQIDIRFFESIGVTKPDRNYLIVALRNRGVTEINGVDIENFFIVPTHDESIDWF